MVGLATPRSSSTTAVHPLWDPGRSKATKGLQDHPTMAMEIDNRSTIMPAVRAAMSGCPTTSMAPPRNKFTVSGMVHQWYPTERRRGHHDPMNPHQVALDRSSTLRGRSLAQCLSLQLTRLLFPLYLTDDCTVHALALLLNTSPIQHLDLFVPNPFR
jgi:hypothetical protein